VGCFNANPKVLIKKKVKLSDTGEEVISSLFKKIKESDEKINIVIKYNAKLFLKKVL